MQGAGRRGKSKPFSVLVLDRILLFFIFAGKTVELSDTEVQLQFSGLTVEDNYVQALTRFSISRGNDPFFLSRSGELNFHFSRCSRMSRF